MSSAAAVASAASGIARRSRVRTVDGLGRNSFRSTPPVSPQDGAAGSLQRKASVAASAAAGLAAPRLVRCRSLTSAPQIGSISSRSYSSAARITSAARRGGSGDWCNDKTGCGGLVPSTTAAAARKSPQLVRCRSLTSAPSIGSGGGGSSRSYASAARITSAARRGDGDWCNDKTGFGGGGAGAGGADGGRFMAGAVVLSAALAASSQAGDETNWGNDRMGGGGSASWGDDRVGGGAGGGGGRSRVWCDGAAASTRRLPSSLRSFQEQASRGAETQQTNNISRINSCCSSGGGSSSCDSSDSDVKQVEIDDLRSSSFEPTSCAAPATSSGRLITDVYRFQGTNDEVGRGQRSVVSTATHRLTGQAVAVKRLSRADTTRLEVRMVRH